MRINDNEEGTVDMEMLEANLKVIDIFVPSCAKNSQKTNKQLVTVAEERASQIIYDRRILVHFNATLLTLSLQYFFIA